MKMEENEKFKKLIQSYHSVQTSHITRGTSYIT